MILNFKTYYPGGNLTALIEQPFKKPDRAKVAIKIMTQFPEIEQVGFLVQKSKRLSLEMMGNELCINAAQCAALHWSMGLKNTSLNFKIPGLLQPIKSLVKKNKVELLLPKSIAQSVTKVPEGQIVTMKGIKYLIFDSNQPITTPLLQSLVKKYRGNFPAIGFIATGNKILSIKPWVWVQATKTLILETACGSGSIALAYLNHTKLKSTKPYQITQPSNTVYGIRFDSINITIEAPVKYLGVKKITI